MRPEAVGPAEVGGHHDVIVCVKMLQVFHAVHDRITAVDVVEVDNESHGDGGGG